MMTKKHYVSIARIVSDGALINLVTQNDVETNKNTRAKIAYQLSLYFASEDTRFDRARFLTACGLEG